MCGFALRTEVGGLEAGCWGLGWCRGCIHTEQSVLGHHICFYYTERPPCSGTVIPLKHGGTWKLCHFTFGLAQNETFGNDDAKTHVCVSVYERGIERECVSEGEQHQVQEDSVHTHANKHDRN